MNVLGEVRSDSVVIADFGRIVRLVKDVGHPSLQPLSVFLDAGVVPRDSREDNFNRLGSDLNKYQRVLPGDLVFNKLRTWQGGFGTSKHEGIVSPAYYVCRPTGAESRFIDYLLHSAPYLAELARVSKWMPPSQFDIAWTDLRAVPLALPHHDEQRRIADFLDDQISRIDAVIKARGKQAHLEADRLVAARQGVLDGLVGRWGSTRLRHIVQRIEQGWSPQADSSPAAAGAWGVVRAGCVNGGHFDETDNKALPADVDPRTEYEIHEGDLLMSRASGSLELIGSVAVVPAGVRARLLLCDKVYRIRVAGGWSTGLVAHALRSHENREAIRLGVSGAEGMANNLPSGVVRELRVPAVPPGYQGQARAELESVESSVRSRIAVLDRSSALLREYKQSLITAAVTGQIDVTTASGRSIPA